MCVCARLEWYMHQLFSSEFSKVVTKIPKELKWNRLIHAHINPSLCCTYISFFWGTFDWVYVIVCLCVYAPWKCLSIYFTIHKFTNIYSLSRHNFSCARCEMAEKMQFIRLICMDLQIALCPNRERTHKIVSFIIYILLMDLRWLFPALRPFNLICACMRACVPISNGFYFNDFNQFTIIYTSNAMYSIFVRVCVIFYRGAERYKHVLRRIPFSEN